MMLFGSEGLSADEITEHCTLKLWSEKKVCNVCVCDVFRISPKIWLMVSASGWLEGTFHGGSLSTSGRPALKSTKVSRSSKDIVL